ncbi:MAG: hypothetical protein CME80_02295 [Halomonas sp.]|nr:hypothetical protein [Halomonas sp.]|tara:strand:+ start:14140 stop:14361 length:222 start_codon:yes stop_codon:yes gene_type:complete
MQLINFLYLIVALSITPVITVLSMPNKMPEGHFPIGNFPKLCANYKFPHVLLSDAAPTNKTQEKPFLMMILDN